MRALLGLAALLAFVAASASEALSAPPRGSWQFGQVTSTNLYPASGLRCGLFDSTNGVYGLSVSQFTSDGRKAAKLTIHEFSQNVVSSDLSAPQQFVNFPGLIIMTFTTPNGGRWQVPGRVGYGSRFASGHSTPITVPVDGTFRSFRAHVSNTVLTLSVIFQLVADGRACDFTIRGLYYP